MNNNVVISQHNTLQAGNNAFLTTAVGITQIFNNNSRGKLSKIRPSLLNSFSLFLYTHNCLLLSVFDCIRIDSQDRTNNQIIQDIDNNLAQHVLALSFLHANPAVPSRTITINGTNTVIQRNQTARLKRTLCLLQHVRNALGIGLLVGLRGIKYVYAHRFGKDVAKSSFAREIKRTVNSLNLHPSSLYTTEESTLAFGEVTITNMTTGEKIDLSATGGTILNRSIFSARQLKFETNGKAEVNMLIVVEKATITRLLIGARFDKTMNAVLITDRGYPSGVGKAWVHALANGLKIKDENRLGLCDFGPHGWSVLHSFEHVKDPIVCESAYSTRLRIVVTPAFMTNFPEARHAKNTELTTSDYNMFKYLLADDTEFFDKVDDMRYGQLKEMYRGKYKCDLDFVLPQKLLPALESAIKDGKAI